MGRLTSRVSSIMASLEVKDRFTIAIAFIALIGTIGSFLTATRACSNSLEANRIAGEAAQINKIDTGLWYSVTFTLKQDRDDGSYLNRVSDPDSEPKKISTDTAKIKGTWLSITVTNIGNRPVTVMDIGLLTNIENGFGWWITSQPYTTPPYCTESPDTDKDIKCYRFPFVVEVGRAATYYWYLPEYVDRLIAEKAADPVSVGIDSRTGIDWYKTGLTIG
ncbi:hypothetical protein OG874_37585 [Nocardia sp. NBC_00565]|uniref:hypothetical protein n=1 Tax=Nocardia sp. NBC_00565 TaxID=2975993 RepID=UPI002E82224A|nr:hypothetical protein [Nocardia sp. NBC_00565]WUC02380.1 hypothetical protein OG874_37585 [Nocardia sp. NBC_00565]